MTRLTILRDSARHDQLLRDKNYSMFSIPHSRPLLHLHPGCPGEYPQFRWTRPSASPMSPRSRPSPIQNAGDADKLVVTLELPQHLNPSTFIVVSEWFFELTVIRTPDSGFSTLISSHPSRDPEAKHLGISPALREEIAIYPVFTRINPRVPHSTISA
jgi:hypothetical protein